jgi:hypothetical protein
MGLKIYATNFGETRERTFLVGFRERRHVEFRSSRAKKTR